MSGRMVHQPGRPNRMPAARASDAGDRRRLARRLRRSAPLRLASTWCATAAEDSHRLLAGLGPEPLDDAFTPAMLAAALAGRARRSRRRCSTRASSPGSATSMSARRCSGRASARGGSPHTVAGARAARLVPAIKATLREAIAAGGSSLRDYVQPDGELGLFPARLEGLRPRGRTLRTVPGAAGLRRHPPYGAVRRAAASIAPAPSAS